MATINFIAVLKQEGSAFDSVLSSTLASMRCLCTPAQSSILSCNSRCCRPLSSACQFSDSLQCFQRTQVGCACDCCSSAITLRHSVQVKTAVQDGYDLRGYHYWTLLDNFEWTFAYDLKFGLYKWDRGDPAGKRTLRNGAKV